MKYFLMMAVMVFSELVMPTLTIAQQQPLDTDSFVFIYINMDDAPTGLKGGVLRQVLPRVSPKDESHNMQLSSVNKNIIFNSFMPNGLYQMSEFEGWGQLTYPHVYSFPRQGKNGTEIRFDSPGIQFIGSYDYKKSEGSGFTFEKSSKPTELELLKVLLNDSVINKRPKLLLLMTNRINELEKNHAK